MCQQASDFSSLRLFETPSDKDASRPTDNSTPLLNNRHNTAEDARATRCDSSVLYNDNLCSGVSVITHAEDSFCDIKQDKHCASLDPLNIVKNYVAELIISRSCAGLKTQIPTHTNSIGCPKIFSLSAPVLYWLSQLTCISSMKAKNVHFHTTKNIQIQSTLFRYF